MEVVTPKEVAAAIDRLGDKLGEWLQASRQQSAGRSEQSYFTREEAADYMRVSTRTVDKWAETGELRRVKLGAELKSKVLFRRVDLDAFLAGRLEMDVDMAREHARSLGI